MMLALPYSPLWVGCKVSFGATAKETNRQADKLTGLVASVCKVPLVPRLSIQSDIQVWRRYNLGGKAEQTGIQIEGSKVDSRKKDGITQLVLRNLIKICICSIK